MASVIVFSDADRVDIERPARTGRARSGELHRPLVEEGMQTSSRLGLNQQLSTLAAVGLLTPMTI